MKKALIFIFLNMLLISGFSLDSAFYKNCERGEYLYVNASSGLRVRDKPSLNAKKTAVIYDRMKVQVFEIGSETVIDGIKSNWVKIILPVETLKNGETYGWVFGGYLTDNLKPFSIKDWTDEDLVRYLSRFTWIENGRKFIHFQTDGSYECGLMESGNGGDGTYTVSIKNKSIDIKVTYGDDSGEWKEVVNEHYMIDLLSEDRLVMHSFKGEMELVPAFLNNSNFYAMLDREKCSYYLDIPFYRDSLNVLFYDFGVENLKKMTAEKENLFSINFYTNLSRMCIDYY